MKVKDAVSHIQSDKKRGELDWREWNDHALRTQALYARAAQSQKFAKIKLGDGKRPVCILPWSDLHWGSRGTDYRIFRTMTEEILETPDLYVALVGDLVEFAIKLRSVAEVCAQIFGPDKQVQFLEDWIAELKPKLILATWGNHEVEREEKQAGVSTVKRLLAEHTIMFDGIGHADNPLVALTNKEADSCLTLHPFIRQALRLCFHQVP